MSTCLFVHIQFAFQHSFDKHYCVSMSCFFAKYLLTDTENACLKVLFPRIKINIYVSSFFTCLNESPSFWRVRVIRKFKICVFLL